MTEELKQTIKFGVEKLPKEVQDIINNFDWIKISEEVGKRNLLDDNEINILQNEIGLILIENKDQNFLALNVENNVGTSKNEAEKITAEINQKIFEPMLEKRDSLVKIIPENKPFNLPVLDSRFSSLPKQVQTAIARSNWRETLYSLAPKYKLTIEQMGILEEITVKVMLNTIHSNSYENELASKITIPKEDISNLVKEINENIFKKIREEEEVITNYQLPITNENKSITNYQLPIKNETLEEEIPLPPYKSITNYQLPIKNEGKIITDDQLPITNEKEIINAGQNNVQDILKKIEPVKPIGPTPQVIKPQIQQPEFNQNIPTPQQTTPSVRSIIEEKLMGSTVSDSTTTDYSVPKKNDPYREPF